MGIKSIFLGCCLGLASIASAALPEVFRVQYNAPSNHSDEGSAIAADGRGGCYVFGSAYHNGLRDSHLLSIGPLGDKRWVKEDRTANEEDMASEIAVDRAGNIWTTSFVRRNQFSALRVCKFTPEGVRLFEIDIDRGTSLVSFGEAALVVDAEGNGYVGCGKNDDMAVAKISSTGIVLWERQIPSPHPQEETTSLVVEPTGGVVAVGIAGSVGGGYITARLDPAGNVLWTLAYEGPIGNTLGPAFINRLSSGDYVIVGNPESTFGVVQYHLLRVSASGTLLWDRPYKPDPQFSCEATGMVLDRQDNIVVAGYRVHSQVNSVVVKYDASGNHLWEADGPGPVTGATCVGVDRMGFITIAGFGRVVRYSPSGAELSQTLRSKDNQTDLDVDAKGSVYVVGTTFNNGTNDDFVFSRFAWVSTLP